MGAIGLAILGNPRPGYLTPMLRSATFSNFTVLPDATWDFAPGINVVVGENGVGKSHLLKAIYALTKPTSGPDPQLSRAYLERAYADKLVGVFRPGRLGRLVKRSRGKANCEIGLRFSDRRQDVKVGFHSAAESKLRIDTAPTVAQDTNPVFFPTRELITLAGWFLPLYDNYALEFDETYRDTVSLLGGPALRGPRAAEIDAIVAPLESLMDGKVTVDTTTGRFALKNSQGNLEMPLVAEGLRKLAMVARLVTTGVLLGQGYLFWDEPETNLNARVIKALAPTIIALARAGIQVFVATHSIYLLRELELLLSQKPDTDPGARFFALVKQQQTISLEQGDDLADLTTIVALDEELEQSDRFMASAS